MNRITSLFRSLLPVAGLLLLNLSSTAQQDPVIFSSPVPLTQSMLENHAQLVQQLLDLRYRPEQQEKHYQLVKNYWLRQDQNGIQAVLGNLHYYEQLQALPAAERTATMLHLRSALILNLTEDAKRAEDARWYLQNYYAAHPPLVPGQLPFLKETADALIDCEQFIQRELKGRPVKPLSPEQRKAGYEELSKVWKTLDHEKQKATLLGASHMSLVFYRWKQMGPLERAGIKQQYVGDAYLTAAEKQALSRAAASASQLRGQQWNLIQNELSFMKKTTDIIMSQGTRWNPATNRYEQIGGIVTEFW